MPYLLELRLLLLLSQMQRDNKNCTKHHSMRGKFEELALFESPREAPSLSRPAGAYSFVSHLNAISFCQEKTTRRINLPVRISTNFIAIPSLVD